MVICKKWHVYCSLTDGNLNKNPAYLVRDKRRMCRTSLVAQTVKNLLTMQEVRVPSLSWEDPLEKGMATHQYSCLENFMGRGVWWATVHEVAKNQTWLSN